MNLAEATTFFDANYRAGHTSGEGSTVDVTTTYRHIIEDFIRLNDVKTVLDVGCGDWQFSRLIPWNEYGISYLGLDVSPYIVEKNSKLYGSERRRFSVVREPSEIVGLGPFDLVICKDALQHMPNAVINEYLDVFAKVGRHSLLTNDAFPADHLNEDIPAGGWRALDLRKSPFSRSSAVIAEYVNFFGPAYFVKHVHLLAGI